MCFSGDHMWRYMIIYLSLIGEVNFDYRGQGVDWFFPLYNIPLYNYSFFLLVTAWNQWGDTVRPCVSTIHQHYLLDLISAMSLVWNPVFIWMRSTNVQLYWSPHNGFSHRCDGPCVVGNLASLWEKESLQLPRQLPCWPTSLLLKHTFS